MIYTRLTKRLVWIASLTLMLGSQVLAENDKFTHKNLTLTLPEGWTVGKVPEGSEKHTIGVLNSSKIKGASITLDCYRGAFHTKASTRIRGLNTLAAVYPKGQEQLKKPFKIKAERGKAKMELWRGFLQAGNQTVALISPMVVMKTKRCLLLMIGFSPESTGKELEDDMVKILKTAE